MSFCVYICRSAHLISRYRPRAPILAVTRNAQTARQAHLYRGIFPVLYSKPAHDVWAEDVDMRVNFAMDMGKHLWTLFASCAEQKWGFRIFIVMSDRAKTSNK